MNVGKEPYMNRMDPRSTVGTPYGLRSISGPFVVHIFPMRSIKVDKIFKNMNPGLSIPGSIRSILVHNGSYFSIFFLYTTRSLLVHIGSLEASLPPLSPYFRYIYG
jgi:hypothetical protein